LGDIFENNCGQMIGGIFFIKQCAQRQKNRPDGEISPNLVTLQTEPVPHHFREAQQSCHQIADKGCQIFLGKTYQNGKRNTY
jgi:hypothetical protein